MDQTVKYAAALLVVIVVAVFLWSGQTSPSAQPTITPTPQATSTTPPGAEEFAFAVADAGAFEGAEKLEVEISRVVVRSDAGATHELQGEATVDLVALKNSGKAVVVAAGQLPAGVFASVSFQMQVKSFVASGAQKQVLMPSSSFTLPLTLTFPSESRMVVADVQASESMHGTGTAIVIFLPVIKVYSVKSSGQVGSEFTLASVGATLKTTVGMNEKGVVAEGLIIPPEVNITIGSSTQAGGGVSGGANGGSPGGASGGGRASPSLGVVVVPVQPSFG